MPAMMPDGPEPGTTRPSTGVCAVVLAAGEGARLRPLTRVLPKPLCPVGGTPLIDHALGRARSATGAVAVNLHHGRAAVEAHLDGRVHMSIEDREPLGTAGALGRLLAGDDRLRPTSPIAAALMPWREVACLEPVPSGLYESSWGALAAADWIDTVRWDGPCLDCGTPARYLAANMAASGGEPVVGDGARVDGQLTRSVVWAGTSVLPGERLVDAVRASDDVTVLVR